jgi:hypothetical protein
MEALAERERFEEAAHARDRLRALAEAMRRDRTQRWLIGAGELRLRDRGGTEIRLVGGSLARGPNAVAPIPDPCPRERADELAAVRSWLAASGASIESADRPPAEPVDGGAELDALLTRLRARTDDDGSRSRGPRRARR